MDDLAPVLLSEFSLPRPRQTRRENRWVCELYGKNRRRRMLYCHTCKARLSKRKGTPLFNSKLTDEQAMATAHPEMAAGLTGQLWSLKAWLTMPGAQRQ